MDSFINDFTKMRIIEQNIDFSNLQIVPTMTHSETPVTSHPTTKQLICALYFENQQLKQQIEQLKALIQSQQVGLPHWVK
tara:strand:+ start:2320 stop:2559 length:240 start_codon:yes stop_codon:yes gene_type:complete